MTNAKIVQPPSPTPPKLVVLEMSMEEAAWLLAKVAGSRRVAAHTIYRALAEAGVPQGALAGGIAFGSSAEEGWRRCQAVNQAADAICWGKA